MGFSFGAAQRLKLLVPILASRRAANIQAKNFGPGTFSKQSWNFELVVFSRSCERTVSERRGEC